MLETCRRCIWGPIPLLGHWKEAATAMVSSGHKVLLSYLLCLGSCGRGAQGPRAIFRYFLIKPLITLSQLHPSNLQEGSLPQNNLTLNESNALLNDDGFTNVF